MRLATGPLSLGLILIVGKSHAFLISPAAELMGAFVSFLNQISLFNRKIFSMSLLGGQLQHVLHEGGINWPGVSMILAWHGLQQSSLATKGHREAWYWWWSPCLWSTYWGTSSCSRCCLAYNIMWCLLSSSDQQGQCKKPQLQLWCGWSVTTNYILSTCIPVHYWCSTI